MALSWSMDKPGPMCRTAADAALVFDAVVGPTPGGEDDASVVDQPWSLPGALTVRGWRVGIDEKAFEGAPEMAHVPDELRALGVELVPFTLPDHPSLELLPILFTEAAAAFDELTRSEGIDLLANQASTGWPSVFRAARLVPAVEYINASRLRTSLMRAVHAAIDGLDAWVHPSHAGMHLVVTNLTGHPAVVCPTAALDGADGAPGSVTFSGQLYDARVLALASAWQASTGHHRRRPSVYAEI
jgi:Asp-tRNA(Asn)/Glu-tRNA(Gln) amidotransferase A subunit family amidase